MVVILLLRLYNHRYDKTIEYIPNKYYMVNTARIYIYAEQSSFRSFHLHNCTDMLKQGAENQKNTLYFSFIFLHTINGQYIT